MHSLAIQQIKFLSAKCMCQALSQVLGGKGQVSMIVPTVEGEAGKEPNGQIFFLQHYLPL